MDPFDLARPEMAAARIAAARQAGGRVPTSEQGVPNENFSVAAPAGALGGVLPWPSYIDDREVAEALRWPLSIPVFEQMQTDAMLATLLTTVAAPVRRFRWEVDPNGARRAVTKHIAASRNLPIRGEDPDQPQDGGFNHDRHLALALQALAFGHMYFEEIYELGSDGAFHLAKLGSRPPRTIANFLVDEHGELLGIVQRAGVTNIFGPAPSMLGGIPLDANRLLPYVWNPGDDGDWLGRSALRPCFKNWLVKDRLIRVDATKHERTGMGVPWVEMDANATREQIEQAAAIAEEVRTSQRGGGAGTGRLRLVGTEGSVPDTVASIRYHDQQMTSAFLAMFVELGKGETGSYSLGSALMDFHSEFIGSVADWYVEATQQQVEDEVLINWGPEEPCPRLAYTRLESQALSFADLALGIEKGAINADESVKAYVRDRWKLPEADEEEEALEATVIPTEPQPQLPPGTEPPPATPPPPAPPQLPPGQAKRGEVARALLAALDRPMPWPELAKAVGRSPKDGTARRARDQLLAEGAIRKGEGRLAPVTGLQLPERELHRNLKPFEVEAAVDFAAMEHIYLDARENLVGAVRAAQGAQFDEAAAAVEAAAGDPEKLGSIQIEPMDPAVLTPALLDAARRGEEAAEAERQAQVGRAAASAAKPDADRVSAEVADRAVMTANVLAQGLGTAASKRATMLATLPPSEAAAQTKAYLEGLSDAALNEQLGGAVHSSYSAGRAEVMRVSSPKAVYASEILDRNTCTQCNAIDGSEYPSVEAGEAAGYAGGGGYTSCEGGLRCRGTLVAVYTSSTAPPTEPRVEPKPAPIGTEGSIRSGSIFDNGKMATEEMRARADFAEERGNYGIKGQPEAIAKAGEQVLPQIDDFMRWPNPEGTPQLGAALREQKSAWGSYNVRDNTIAMNPFVEQTTGAWRATWSHELGHRLEALMAKHVLGGNANGLASWAARNQQLFKEAAENDYPALIEALDTIEATPYVQKIKRLVESKKPPPGASMEHLEYLLEPGEQFARSFSQYVATKAGDEAAKEALARKLGNFWPEEEFTQIEAALDKLFGPEGYNLLK